MNPELYSADNLKPESLIHRLWRWFFAPSPHVTEPDQRRQGALLSTLLLGIIFLAVIVETITVMNEDRSYTGYWRTIAVVCVLAGLYGFSRTRHIRVTGLLTAVSISAACFVLALADPPSILAGLLDYLIVSIWLASLFITSYELLLLIAVHLLAILTIPYLTPVVSTNDILIGPFSFILVTSMLIFLLTSHRNALEKDRRKELTQKERSSRLEAGRSAALLHVAERLNAQLDLDILLNSISEEVMNALNVPVSIVSLYDARQKILTPATGTGLSVEEIKTLFPVPKVFFDQISREMGTTYATQDLLEIIGLPGIEQYKRLNLRSMAFAIMVYERELIGSLNAFTVEERRVFTEEELLLLQGIAHQAALAIVNTRLYNDARRRLEQLQALRAVDVAISSNHDLRRSLEVLLEQITKQLKVDAAVILILDKDRQYLEYAASRGFTSPTLRFTRLRIGQGIAGRAAQQRKIIRIDDLRTDPQTLTHSLSLAREGFTSYYAAPLISHGEVTAVLEIFHRTALDPDEEWLNFLETLAGQAAIAIESTSLFGDLQQLNEELFNAYDSTIEGWSHALDLRDKETEGHTLRVTKLTLEIAQAFGFSEAELVHIRRGGMLHDIGKMGIPDRILLKEGPLTAEEWEIMRQHPGFAYEMLLPIEYLRPALDIPYCHHEKWDGTGYPRGLKGEEIPLVARIFAVVDVWDALISDRPYRPAWSLEKAISYIREQAGTHFDPHIVQVFLERIQQTPWENE